MTTHAWTRNRAFVSVLALLTLTTAWSGCIREVDEYYSFLPEDHYVNPGVFPGNYRAAEFPIGSSVLVPRRLTVGDPELYRLPSSHPHSAASGQPEAPAESTVYITIAAWVPSNGSMGQVPVILIASPYFEMGGRTMRYGDTDLTVAWLLRNYFPLGYAIAVVGVRGTGTSGGCMEFLGPREAADLDQAVRFLATQDWSNGKVGMIGLGYEGATPWLVAASGNEFLKTIVPVSGWADTFGSLFHNGTVEAGAGQTHLSFWGAGVGGNNNPPPRPTEVPEPGPPVPTGIWVPRPFSANGREAYQDRQNLLCDEAYRGFAVSEYSAVAGDRAAEAADFWQQRDYRQRVIENYEGSVFLIHGLQDWMSTSDPHNAITFNTELREGGIEVKEWFGQWAHGFPDGWCPKSAPLWLTTSCRADFAETLLHWFEYYLKDNTTADRGPWTQVQDNRGYWRNADTFPSTNASLLEFRLHGNGSMDTGSSSDQTVRLAPPLEYGPVENAPRNLIELKTEPFAEDVRISGLPELHITFEADGPGGVLAGWLFDESGDGKVYSRLNRMPTEPPIIGHAQMDLRFHQGGDESQPLVAGERYVARMQFEPLDILIPKGHRLTLWVLQYPYPDRQDGSVPSAVAVVLGDASVLRLPIITVDHKDTFPVPGAHFPDAEYFDWANVRKPDYPELPTPPASDARKGQ